MTSKLWYRVSMAPVEVPEAAHEAESPTTTQVTEVAGEMDDGGGVVDMEGVEEGVPEGASGEDDDDPGEDPETEHDPSMPQLVVTPDGSDDGGDAQANPRDWKRGFVHSSGSSEEPEDMDCEEREALERAAEEQFARAQQASPHPPPAKRKKGKRRRRTAKRR